MDRGEGCAVRGLIVDFAGDLATGIRELTQDWRVEQGLTAHAWRHTLETDPAGRERYRALETGRLSQAEWNRATARTLGLARRPFRTAPIGSTLGGGGR
jgi:putative hydrolase of the HAD superfamily